MQKTLHLERGNVVGARRGESSASVGSEESSHGPSSTTRVGIAPLPCSMDTTFSWEQFLQQQRKKTVGLYSYVFIKKCEKNLFFLG